MEGPLFLSSIAPKSKILGNALDLDFKNGRYYLNSGIVSASTLSAYFSRSSSAIGQLANGDYAEFGIDEPRIIKGVGYHSEEAATGLIDPVDMQAYGYTASSPVVTDYEDHVFGLFDQGITISSSGNSNGRAGFSIAMTSGNTYAFQCLVREGSSGKFRLVAKNGDTSSSIGGVFDSVASTNVSLGAFTNVSEQSLGNGFRWINAFYTPNITSTIHCAVGPNSAIVGDDVHLIAMDIKEAGAFTSISNGARALDAFIIPAYVVNLDASQGFVFVKLKQQDQEFPRSAFSYYFDMRVDGANRVSYLSHRDDRNVKMQHWADGSNQFTQSTDPLTFGQTHIIGSSWGGGDIRSIVNGVEATISEVFMPSGSSAIGLGTYASGSGGNMANVIIERVVIGDNQLTHSEQDALYQELVA